MQRARRRTTATAVGFAFGLAAGAGSGHARPAFQAPDSKPLVSGSISGTLVTVDQRLNGVILRTASGEKMAWKLDAGVVAEAAKFKAGDRLWIIYRQRGPGERAVTALGFPGKAPRPIYINATGTDIVLRTGPMAGGACQGDPEASQVREFRLPPSGTTEGVNPCWCCAASDQTCQPANRSYEPATLSGAPGPTGTIILARCFP
jgi:hypothetical protein